MLKQNLARGTDNWKRYDDEMAFAIFMVEKEFNVGLIDEKFPLLKFWNLVDQTNLERYKQMIEGKTSTGHSDIITMG